MAELVQLKVDVSCLTVPLSVIRRGRSKRLKRFPIVMVITADPVATGLVDELSAARWKCRRVLRRLTRELSGKRLELLKEVSTEDIARGGHALWMWMSTDFKD